MGHTQTILVHPTENTHLLLFRGKKKIHFRSAVFCILRFYAGVEQCIICYCVINLLPFTFCNSLPLGTCWCLCLHREPLCRRTEIVLMFPAMCVETQELRIIYLKSYFRVSFRTHSDCLSIVNMTQSEDKQDTMHFLYLSEELWKIGHCLPTCAL